ncbi:HbrB-like-domain-containing protein [Hygrophoropsis aurantiaca]|uniref:HbrB-like-domain-containing protein n=1 Tax=Hygrophoropsis aurantiaca TaxID=72124 RepID=A0ACB8AQC2_9AGAM|nr:HbrB-like-domain-containing protein [Hygrophoropsis aurantiaca]
MLLSRARRSYDSGPSTPPLPTVIVDNGEEKGDSEHGPERKQKKDHRRSASSNDATPRPKTAIPRTGPFMGLSGFLHDHHHQRKHQPQDSRDTDNSLDFDSAAPPSRHHPNNNILTPDPFLASTSGAHQNPSKRLGFLSPAGHSSKSSSPSRSSPRSLSTPERSHAHSQSDTATAAISIGGKDYKFPSSPMTSAASSNTLAKNASPSKASSNRTYDPKLVTREMHRLGTLAGFSPSLAPSLSTGASASTLTLAPSTSPSSTAVSTSLGHALGHGLGGVTGSVISDKDNPWGTLHVHVLPLFNEEPLRVPIEDLNTLVRRHIKDVLSAPPSKALSTLVSDTRELIGAGMVTLNAKLDSSEDDLLIGRVVELWSFFWDHILPYIEGVLLPLQTDPLLSSLHRTPKQHRMSSPTRQGSVAHLTALSPGSSSIDVRNVALCSFRDRVVLPLYSRLKPLLTPPLGKVTLAKLTEYRQPRLQQMLLVLASERRYRPPSPSLPSRVPEMQPSAGESAIADLLRLISNPQQPTKRSQLFGQGLAMRPSTPSFLSAGLPRDRRGRIGQRGLAMGTMIGWIVHPPPPPPDPVDDDALTAERDDNDGGETPRIGGMEPRYRDTIGPLRPGLEQHRVSTGGWGLGAGNENNGRGREEDDEDEVLDWDQAQAVVERMVGMKPNDSPTDLRRRVT